MVINACDLVAGLLSWNGLILKWLAWPETPARIDFPETGYKWNALGALAQKFYADYQGGDHDDLSGDLNRAKTAIVYQVNIRSNVSLSIVRPGMANILWDGSSSLTPWDPIKMRRCDCSAGLSRTDLNLKAYGSRTGLMRLTGLTVYSRLPSITATALPEMVTCPASAWTSI